MAMPWYSVNTSVMTQSLRTGTRGVKQVWLADDSEEGGQIVPLVQSPESVVSLSSEWIKELADCQVEPTYR